MKKTNKILVLIPTYNNEKTIKQLIQEISYCIHYKNILVINDGSNDETYNILLKEKCHTINNNKNMGKGYCIKKGINWGIKNNYTHILTIDSDGQHNPKDIPKFLNLIKSKPNTILIGSRELKFNNSPVKNIIGRLCSNLLFFIITGKYLNDTQSGFRVYPINLIKKLNIYSNYYDFEYEILLKAYRNKINIMEIKIENIYTKYSKKHSNYRTIKDSFNILKTVFK